MSIQPLNRSSGIANLAVTPGNSLDRPSERHAHPGNMVKNLSALDGPMSALLARPLDVVVEPSKPY